MLEAAAYGTAHLYAGPLFIHQLSQCWIDFRGIQDAFIVIMIENYRSGLPWRLMRGHAPLAEGLRRAGFAGGWLDGATP